MYNTNQNFQNNIALLSAARGPAPRPPLSPASSQGFRQPALHYSGAQNANNFRARGVPAATLSNPAPHSNVRPPQSGPRLQNPTATPPCPSAPPPGYIPNLQQHQPFHHQPFQYQPQLTPPPQPQFQVQPFQPWLNCNRGLDIGGDYPLIPQSIVDGVLEGGYFDLRLLTYDSLANLQPTAHFRKVASSLSAAPDATSGEWWSGLWASPGAEITSSTSPFPLAAPPDVQFSVNLGFSSLTCFPVAQLQVTGTTTLMTSSPSRKLVLALKSFRSTPFLSWIFALA